MKHFFNFVIYSYHTKRNAKFKCNCIIIVLKQYSPPFFRTIVLCTANWYNPYSNIQCFAPKSAATDSKYIDNHYPQITMQCSFETLELNGSAYAKSLVCASMYLLDFCIQKKLGVTLTKIKLTYGCCYYLVDKSKTCCFQLSIFFLNRPHLVFCQVCYTGEIIQSQNI